MIGAALLILLAGAVVWVLSRLLWPYASCRRCAGSRRNPGSTSRRWGNCKRCGGSGTRRRTGAKAVHQLLTTARDRGK